MAEVLPAILSQTREDLAAKIKAVPSAKALHIDLMDGKFVNNRTIGAEGLEGLIPEGKEVEFHLMVSDPAGWMERLPAGKKTTFEVHVEAVRDGAGLEKILAIAKKKKGKLALVLNPPTPLEKLDELLRPAPAGSVSQVLVMTVNPGWAGQEYIRGMEEKMKALRARHPGLVIEVDGGVNSATARSALRAGASRFAAANALFKAPDPEQAYQELKRLLNP